MKPFVVLKITLKGHSRSLAMTQFVCLYLLFVGLITGNWLRRRRESLSVDDRVTVLI